MKEKIHIRKLCFLHHLKHLGKSSLGAEFYDIQVKLKYSGLVNECRNLIRFYDLPNIIDPNIDHSKQVWKNLVKDLIKVLIIKETMREYSKLKELETENLELKEYVKEMTVRNARTKFRLCSHMLKVKMNRKSDPKNS